MKVIHEAIDIMIEAGKKGINGLSLDTNMDVKVIHFWHIDRDRNISKQISAYFNRDLKDYTTGCVVKLSDFIDEINKHLESCG